MRADAGLRRRGQNRRGRVARRKSPTCGRCLGPDHLRPLVRGGQDIGKLYAVTDACRQDAGRKAPPAEREAFVGRRGARTAQSDQERFGAQPLQCRAAQFRRRLRRGVPAVRRRCGLPFRDVASGRGRGHGRGVPAGISRRKRSVAFRGGRFPVDVRGALYPCGDGGIRFDGPHELSTRIGRNARR